MSAGVEWAISDGLTDYEQAVAAMEARAAAIRAGGAAELVWLVEHAPLYTAGTSADPADLIDPERFRVHTTGRGGEYTYHGPGQRVAYVMLDLTRRQRDVRRFVRDLEDWVIAALGRFNVRGERRADRVGVWVARGGGREDKIAAIGVRIRRWVSFHGVAVNVEPELEHFAGIRPCGVADTPTTPYGVTSLVDLGHPCVMADMDVALRVAFEQVFGRTTTSVNAPGA